MKVPLVDSSVVGLEHEKRKVSMKSYFLTIGISSFTGMMLRTQPIKATSLESDQIFEKNIFFQLSQKFP